VVEKEEEDERGRDSRGIEEIDEVVKEEVAEGEEEEAEEETVEVEDGSETVSVWLDEATEEEYDGTATI
jgi:hypothetical protein